MQSTKRSTVSFDKLIGQETVIAPLKAALSANRLGHAYLFLGPSGSGRFTLATELVKAFFCLNRVDSSPCDQCRNCKRIETGQHPDAAVLEPEEDRMGLAVETARECVRILHLTPFEGMGRSVIFRNANFTIQSEAANTLLKILEEPPPDSLLILTVESLEDVQKTIASRCAQVQIRPLDADLLIDKLTGEEQDPDAARFYAAISQGSLGQARDRAEAAGFQEYEQTANLITGLTQKTIFETAEQLLERMKTTGGRKLATQRKWLNLLMDHLLVLFRDLMLCATASSELAASRRIAETLIQTRGLPSAAVLERCILRIIDCRKQIRANVHPPLLVESLVMDLAKHMAGP